MWSRHHPSSQQVSDSPSPPHPAALWHFSLSVLHLLAADIEKSVVSLRCHPAVSCPTLLRATLLHQNQDAAFCSATHRVRHFPSSQEAAVEPGTSCWGPTIPSVHHQPYLSSDSCSISPSPLKWLLVSDKHISWKQITTASRQHHSTTETADGSAVAKVAKV